MDLLRKIEKRSAHIGIIGLGYVGLPLVLRYCEEGFRVKGFDVDRGKVKKLNSGRSYIKHILSKNIKQARNQKLFEATTDYSKLKQADCIIICVPTPLKKNKEPDLSYIKSYC